MKILLNVIVLLSFFCTNSAWSKDDPEEESMKSADAAVVAIKIGVSVVSAINSHKDKKRISKELKFINDNLSELLELQQDILKEIINLKVYFNEQLRNEFIENTNTKLKSRLDEFDFIIAKYPVNKKYPKSFISEIEELQKKVLPIAFQLRHYGPAAYESAYLAMNFLRTIFIITNESKSAQIEAFKKFEESTNDWLNSDISGSFVNQLNKSTVNKSAMLSKINSQAKQVIKHHHMRCWCHRQSCSEQEWIVITGSLESGFGYRLEKRNRSCSGRITEMKGNDNLYKNELNSIEKELTSNEVNLDKMDKQELSYLLSVDNKDLEHDITRNLNHWRSTYFEEVSRTNKLKVIIKGVENMRETARMYQKQNL